MGIGVGIEIAPDGVHGVVLDGAPTRPPKVLAMAAAMGDTSQTQALTGLLARLRQELRIRQPVMLGLPATSAIIAGVEALVVQPPRALFAVQFELQQLLPYALQDAAWHYVWWPAGLRAVPGKGPQAVAVRRAAVVVAVRTALLRERLQSCRQAGVQVRGVSAGPVALWNLWALQRENTAAATPTALLHVRSLQAVEWLLAEAGGLQAIPLAHPASAISEAVTAWEGFSPPPARLWVMGAAEACRPFQEALVSKGAVVEWFDPTRAMTGLSSRLVATAGALPALGLGLQAAGWPVALPLNLIQGVQAQQQQRQARRLTTTLTGVLLALAGLQTAAGMWARHRGLAGQLAMLREQEALYQTLRPEAKALLQQQQELQARTAIFEALLAQKTRLPQLLADIAEALPEDVWLTTLQAAKDGPVSALLEGRAASFAQVTEFFERLKRLGQFATVKPLSTNVTTDPATGRELIAFSVQVQRSPGVH